MKKVLVILLVAMLAASSAFASGSSESGAAGLPKSVEVYVPAKAGGGTDVMARALANQMAADSGSAFTVINNTDGNGVVSMETIRTAKGDGTKILQYHTSMEIKTATGVYKYSAAEDFKVIAASLMLDKAAYVLVVASDAPYQTVDEVVAYAKANPGKLLCGVETGGNTHIMSGMFSQAAGIEIKYVEAGTDTEKLTSIVGGNIDIAFVNMNQAKQYIEAGKVTALAVCARDPEGGRGVALPDVPCFQEFGINFNYAVVNLFLGPATMSDELADLYHDAYVKAYENPAVKDFLEPAGFGMVFLSREESIERIKADQQAISEVVEALGLKQK